MTDDKQRYLSAAARDAVLRKGLKQERKRLDDRLATLPSFIRGLQVGALFIGGVNTIIPGQFGVIDWPLWLRVICGGIFLMIALNFLIAQRGFMVASARSRA